MNEWGDGGTGRDEGGRKKRRKEKKEKENKRRINEGVPRVFAEKRRGGKSKEERSQEGNE